MKVENRVTSSKQQMAEFNENGQEEPIYMLNLLKFKAKAAYVDKRTTQLTGEEAYSIYAQEVQNFIEDVGGKSIFAGNINRLMLGEVEELWDKVGIVMYPSRKAMLKMVTNPDYLKSAEHRTAGLEGQLNIETNL